MTQPTPLPEDPAPDQAAPSETPDDSAAPPDALPGMPPAPPTPRRRRRSALSPSRAKDFRQCPLMFRLRVVDEVPEPPSPAALRGTLVHSVLEHLYDLEPAERTPEAALALLEREWPALRDKRPEVDAMFADSAEVEAWLGAARDLVRAYFAMENPRRLAPDRREAFVEAELDSGVLLRGVIDRVDVAPNGAVRVVDYKTGRSPKPRYTEEALFQLRFYALILQRLRGSIPARLQILYLRDGRTLTHDPLEAEIAGAAREIDALWEQIEATARSGDFRSRETPLCGWCHFHRLCPAKGGVAPEIPAEGVERLLQARRANLSAG